MTRRRLFVALLIPGAAAVAGLALFAPPVVPSPAPPDLVAVDPTTGLAEPGDDPAGGVTSAIAPTLYTGGFGPDSPVEVATVEIDSGRYVLRLFLAGRFSALTADPLSCYLVERTSGIALEPRLTLVFSPTDGWATARADLPIDLPGMTVAADCTTPSAAFGRLEVLQATLVAEGSG